MADLAVLDLYRLPGRRSERQRVRLLLAVGILISASGGVFLGAQWVPQNLAHELAPIADLTGSTSLRVLQFWLAAVCALALWRRSSYALPLLPVLVALTWSLRHPLFAPWDVLDLPADDRFLTQASIIAFLLALPPASFAWIHASRALAALPKYGDAHGSAAFAHSQAVEKSGLLEGRGATLGYYRGQPLRASEDDHVFLFAPPGAGKTTAIAVPTLLSWTDSVLVFDTKSELFDLTAGYRQQLGHDILRLDFSRTGDEVAHYNPLRWIEPGNREIVGARIVADYLLPSTSPGETTFWRSRGHELLTALLLHSLYTESSPSIASCRALLRSRPIREVLAVMALSAHDPAQRWGWVDSQGEPTSTHPEVAGTAISLLSMAIETRSGVVANAEEALSVFADPRIARNTADAHFRASDLLDRPRPVSMYLTLPAGELDQLSRLLRLFLGHFSSELLQRDVPSPAEKPRRLLVLLDEFPLFGRLKFLEKAGAVLRGYGVTLLVIVQSTTQVRDIYGPYESISSICPVHVAMGGTDLETAKRLSERLGQQTILTERSSARVSGPGGSTLSDNVHARPLLTADEVARLPHDRLLVLPTGLHPILADRRRYFEDPALREKTRIAAPRVSARFDHDWPQWIRQRPTPPTSEEIARFLDQW
jgi:type IV secretion system protein VirD4